jgi:hypothetical protein
MTIDPLIEVADLLRAGKTEEAQKLLRPILKAEPHNLSAWQLAAESMRTPEEKQAVLDLCLRFNPASAAVQPAAAKTETSSSPLQAMTVASADNKTEPARKQRNSLLRILLIAAVLIGLGVLAYLYWQPLLCSLNLEKIPCTRVLFIGNSYTYVNDLPDMFSNLAWSGGHTVLTDMAAEGGWALSDHLGSADTLNKLKAEKWNFVVLQEQSELPASVKDRTTLMYPAARNLAGKAKKDGATTVFFLTWGHRDGWPEDGLASYADMQAQLNTGYEQIANELDVPLAPVGVAWSVALQLDPKLELWQSDGSHPSEAGSYLAACVFYATVFRESPVGLTYTANLPKVTARELQTVAAQTVLTFSPQWNLE